MTSKEKNEAKFLLRISHELNDKLENRAEKTNISKNGLINYVLNEYFERLEVGNG